MRLLNVPILITFLFLFVGPAAVAQKADENQGPVGIFDSRAQYHQFMGDAKRLAYGENGTPELRAMIPFLNDIALDQAIGTTAGQYNTEGTTLGLLADDSVRKELEMVDDQYQQLQKMSEDIQRRMGEQIKGLDFSNPGVSDQIKSMRRAASDELNSLLLPHQQSRLNQLRIQSQLRRKSFVQILTSEPVKTELKISEGQSIALREAEKEIEQELQREIRKLRIKARKKILDKLNSKQKEGVDQLFGDAFDFSEWEDEKGKQSKRKRVGNTK